MKKRKLKRLLELSDKEIADLSYRLSLETLTHERLREAIKRREEDIIRATIYTVQKFPKELLMTMSEKDLITGVYRELDIGFIE